MFTDNLLYVIGFPIKLTLAVDLLPPKAHVKKIYSYI